MKCYIPLNSLNFLNSNFATKYSAGAKVPIFSPVPQLFWHTSVDGYYES